MYIKSSSHFRSIVRCHPAWKKIIAVSSPRFGLDFCSFLSAAVVYVVHKSPSFIRNQHLKIRRIYWNPCSTIYFFSLLSLFVVEKSLGFTWYEKHINAGFNNFAQEFIDFLFDRPGNTQSWSNQLRTMLCSKINYASTKQ